MNNTLQILLLQWDGEGGCKRVTCMLRRVSLFACPADMKIAFSPSSVFLHENSMEEEGEGKN